MNKAVIDLGFGDGGKGRVVDFLASISDEKTLVIRYSGGHQSAHQVVVEDNVSHVFSQFGSGTLQGKPTYYSKYCTVEPFGLVREFNELVNKNFNPIIYIDGKCPVTTPYDVTGNISLDSITKHGTCGVGFGETLKREDNFYSLLFEDILNPTVLKIKLKLISDYYINNGTLESDVIKFIKVCSLLSEYMDDNEYINLTYDIPLHLSNYNLIFESSQGLLLDQNFGFFPHVTRSSVGSKNILNLTDHIDELYLVTRAYQVRHGNGPMTNTDKPHNIKENPVEKNVSDGIQGEFRKSILDLDLLEYSMNKDDYIRYHNNKILVITCMDLIVNNYMFTYRGEMVYSSNETEFVEKIKEYLGIDNILISDSPNGLLKGK